MQLEELRRNFLSLSHAEAIVFVEEYRKKREEEITSSLIKVRKKSTGKRTREKKVTVTDEQLQLLKALGLV